MKTIDITTILGSELKSRTSARDFRAVKETADAPRKTVVSDGPLFFNPATIKQLSEYLTTL